MTNLEEIWTTGFIIDKVESGSSSLRVLFLSADRNLIWLTAKGARTSKTILGNQLQSFSLLSLKLGGNKYNYINDVKAESLPLTYSGITGFCSHYLNELIKYLLQPSQGLDAEDREAAWELFCIYKEALLALFQASNNLQQQLTLRAFEVKLLHYASSQGLLDFNFNLAEFEASEQPQIHGFIHEYGFAPLSVLQEHTDIAPQIKAYLLQGLNASQIEQQLRLAQKQQLQPSQSVYNQEAYPGDPLALEFLERSFQLVKTYFQYSFPESFFSQAKLLYLEPEPRFKVSENQLAKLKLEAKKIIEQKQNSAPKPVKADSLNLPTAQASNDIGGVEYPLDTYSPENYREQELMSQRQAKLAQEEQEALNLVKQAKLAKLESEAELILYKITQELEQAEKTSELVSNSETDKQSATDFAEVNNSPAIEPDSDRKSQPSILAKLSDENKKGGENQERQQDFTAVGTDTIASSENYINSISAPNQIDPVEQGAKDAELKYPTSIEDLEDPAVLEAFLNLDEILASSRFDSHSKLLGDEDTYNNRNLEERDHRQSKPKTKQPQVADETCKITTLDLAEFALSEKEVKNSKSSASSANNPGYSDDFDAFEHLEIDAEKLHEVLAEFAVVISDHELLKLHYAAPALSRNADSAYPDKTESELLNSRAIKTNSRVKKSSPPRVEEGKSRARANKPKTTKKKDWEYETLILEQNLVSFAQKFTNYGYLEQIPNLPLFMNQSKQYTQFLLNLALGHRELHSRKLMQEYLTLTKEFS